MRETMKNLIKSTITSIGIALTIFCITGMVFDIAYDGNFSLDNYQFSKMVIGCIIVGLGFGLPTMIYHKDNLPMPFKVIIHMGTGCVIYTIVAYTVGWIGGTSSILHGIIAAIFQIALAFIIWGCFMLHYRNDARKMNEKIKELQTLVRTACLWSDTLQYRTKKRGQIKPIYIEFDLPRNK